MKNDRYASGLHVHRLKDSKSEHVFAKAWQKLHENGGKHLNYLLTCDGDPRFPATPSDRDYQVAATVVQWLGSPVGLKWVEETLAKAKAASAAQLDDERREAKALTRAEIVRANRDRKRDHKLAEKKR